LAWFPPFLVGWLLAGGLLVGGATLLAGCATVLAERTPFRATDDLVTTTPRYLVEAGHSELVSPPAGVRFALELQAVRETPARGTPSQHYELLLTVTRRRTAAIPGEAAGIPGKVAAVPGAAVPWEADVHGCELVDDEGVTLRPAQILRQTPAATSGQALITTTHQLIFDLPLSYRPQRIGRLTVHWALVAPPRPPVRISSRFQR